MMWRTCEHFDGILDRRGNAASHHAVRRNDVADGAAEEHVAGFGLQDQIGNDARVGTGDEEGVGRLTIGEEAEALLLAGKDLRSGTSHSR